MWYTKFNILIPNGKFSGEVATTCPKCSPDRKKKTDKCLSVNLTKQTFHCNHCGHKGGSGFQAVEVVPEYVYVKPEWKNNTVISDAMVKWFEKRGIRQNTLSKARVTESSEYMPQVSANRNTINFNYFLDGVLYNVKYRDGAKNFKMFKGAQLIPYHADALITQSQEKISELYIVEGEMDCLSFMEVGIDNVISVPNGASLTNNNLDYLNEFADFFEKIGKIYIAVDNDPAGRKLRYDLAFRLGLDKCQYIEFEGCKDANEALLKHGSTALIKASLSAKSFPIEGAFNVSDFFNDVNDLFINGLQPGDKIGLRDFDELISFVKGYITGITGIPSHGKSDFVDQIIIGLLLRHDWKVAYFSPENKPTQLHIAKLLRKLMGRHPDLTEVKMAMNYLNSKVFFINPEEDFTLDSILSKVKQLKLRHGIDCFVIDAWNKLDHQYANNEPETKYIGRSLDKMANFCKTTETHCFLVAHPFKMQKNKDGNGYMIPTLYDIAGSANFYNKLDNGIVVYRDFANDSVIIDVPKVKFNHWGLGGRCQFKYDIPSGRYHQDGYLDQSPWIIASPEKETIQPQPPVNNSLPAMKMKPNEDFYNPEPKSHIDESGVADYLNPENQPLF